MLDIRKKGHIIMAMGIITLTLSVFYLLLGTMNGKSIEDPKLCDCEGGANPETKSEGWYSEILQVLVERLREKDNPLVSFNIQTAGGALDQSVIQPAGQVLQQYTPPHPGTTPATLQEQFKQILNDKNRETIFEVLTKLSQTAQEKGFTYMLYSGTLLGSYRHHDIIPWDDDIDVFMNFTNKESILDALKEHSPKCEIFIAGARVKFYSTDGIQTSSYSWKWPYVDISFFKENSTHLWDASMESDYGDRAYVFPKEEIFPLHLRPLGGHFYNAPRDSFATLRRTYDIGNLLGCATPYYSHQKEALSSGGVIRKPCRDLKEFVPFVHRSPDEKGMRETLMKGQKIIHTLVVDEPKYALSQAYKVDYL